MMSISDFPNIRARKPYWLLLALALFFSSQIATASHWHNDAAKLDADCVLCVLSSATGAAIISDAVTVACIALCVFIFSEIACAFLIQHTRSYDSRAPPVFS